MRVGFFVPCYIDALAPQAAISSFNLLRRFEGLEVGFVNSASCCALPFTDMGYERHACKLETRLVPMFRTTNITFYCFQILWNISYNQIFTYMVNLLKSI